MRGVHDETRPLSAARHAAAAMLFVSCLGLISPANAQTIGSSYTSTAPKDCRVIGKPERASTAARSRVCPGKAGLVVLISEDDLRETVSVGRNRRPRPRSRRRRPGSARSIRPRTRSNGGRRTASRSRSSSAGTSPTTPTPTRADGPTTKPMLAVTRLPPGPVCHVAYVDGQANPNANELARKAADEFARDFKCGKDEVKVIGETGTAVGLAKR